MANMLPLWVIGLLVSQIHAKPALVIVDFLSLHEACFQVLTLGAIVSVAKTPEIGICNPKINFGDILLGDLRLGEGPLAHRIISIRVRAGLLLDQWGSVSISAGAEAERCTSNTKDMS